MPDTVYLVDVLRCARCGLDHHALEFKLFNGDPIVDSDGTIWERWGICPTTGDPILLKEDNEPPATSAEEAVG